MHTPYLQASTQMIMTQDGMECEKKGENKVLKTSRGWSHWQVHSFREI